MNNFPFLDSGTSCTVFNNVMVAVQLQCITMSCLGSVFVRLKVVWGLHTWRPQVLESRIGKSSVSIPPGAFLVPWPIQWKDSKGSGDENLFLIRQSLFYTCYILNTRSEKGNYTYNNTKGVETNWVTLKRIRKRVQIKYVSRCLLTWPITLEKDPI